MARIAGVDLPQNKRVWIALTYISASAGRGAAHPATRAAVDLNRRVRD